MSISIPEGTVRKAVILVAAGVVLLLLMVAPAFAAEPQDERRLMCQGPVSVIADDDPGLALYADIIAGFGIEEAKRRLAFNRGEACGDDEQNALAGASVSAIAAAVEHICLADDEGKACRLLRRAAQPVSVVTYQERAEAAERRLCPNGLNGWDERSGPSCD